MDKSGGLAVQRRPTKRRRRRNKSLVRSVAEYLISDSYMYAALVDPPAPDPAAAAESVNGVTVAEMGFNSTWISWIDKEVHIWIKKRISLCHFQKCISLPFFYSYKWRIKRLL